ncbi:uncharacterized protein N7496_006059 [Penicillium cataractarum]|uniref:DUF7779 domain-containing protein n=1 Tax=Penicillium cataractarum TaxID=2100454 RepID=A0A9W9S0T8_9EURO|nr:uncharacterized protein N7496_006059 [Penicillium cataractarum]KAJ5369967.1 hypothetical protein N7496_006059 [Penicillium cataractarum]
MVSKASVSFGGNNLGLQIGNNHGSIHAEFHPPERPETPPSPLSTVPFPRDPDFVRRNTLVDQIHHKRTVPGSRTALVGLGGVGKSQLAIEYSYIVRSESPATWVFWLHGSNEARFEQSFRDIADELKLAGRRDPGVNIFQQVENFLRDEKKGRWICVIDNVEDEFLCSIPPARKDDPTKGPTNTPTKPLLEYVPRRPNGFTILTSRSREIALKMVNVKDLIDVKPMERSEALDLFQKKTDRPEDSLESQQLVEMLEFMPLAIVQAASYIRNRAPRCSVAQYLRKFQENDREAIKLLKKEASHLSRDWEASNSILVTWQLSFDYIHQTKPSAAGLLSLMSFYDRQGIPEYLIRHQPDPNDISLSELQNDSSDWETSESDIGPDFEDDIATLRDFSFISISESSTFFMMHRLVQLAMRAWLKSHGQINQLREIFIKTLFDEFPTGEYENWKKCRSIFPHVKSAMSQRPASPTCLQQWATLLYRGAWYASESGIIADVKEMAEKSRRQRMILFGDDHEDVVDSTAMLATAYWREGRWEEAEKLQVQVIEIRKTKLGEDHPDTLTSIANLASTYRDQGRWEEAEQLEVQVMEMSKMKLGEDHPDTLSSIGDLALTYSDKGRWEEAEQLQLQVMEKSRMKLGEHHPATLTSMANLALTLWNQGRWEEAEKLEVQVMETRKKQLGEDHPDTLISMANLASTFSDQGRWEEAEELEVQVMKLSKMKLGEDHPDTLLSMANLASTYRDQGRWKEAEQLEVQVMETRKAKLGEDHPVTLTSMANLALTLCNEGRWEEAEKLEVQVMEKSRMKLGEDHPDTLMRIGNLAATYADQGRWKEAEQLQLQVMETCKKKLGEDHPDTLLSMANLASTYGDQGRWKEAEQLQLQVMETCKKKLGEDHPDTLLSMANLASTYGDQGRWKEAGQLEVQVMEKSKMKLGEDHPDTLASMANLAFTWKSSGHDSEAINLLRNCLAKRKQILGPNHPKTVSNSESLLEWETEALNVNAYVR